MGRVRACTRAAPTARPHRVPQVRVGGGRHAALAVQPAPAERRLRIHSTLTWTRDASVQMTAGWSVGLTFPAPCTAVRLGWRGVPSGTVTFQPTSPRKFRAATKSGRPWALLKSLAFVRPAHHPRSRHTAGGRPSPSGSLEGVGLARRSAGQCSPICPPIPFPTSPFPPAMPGDVHLP